MEFSGAAQPIVATDTSPSQISTTKTPSPGVAYSRSTFETGNKSGTHRQPILRVWARTGALLLRWPHPP